MPDAAVKIPRQERLKKKLQEKKALDEKRSLELKRKRQQVVEFVAVLADGLAQGDQRILDGVDSLFQVIEWEKANWPEGVPEQEPRERMKGHLAASLSMYLQALKHCMEQKKAKEVQA